MKFYFEQVILWSRDGKKRELTFLPNKVNVITGDSKTGKSAILQIIDYCFFASHSKISESIINENVSWYGINFRINDKHFTICRASLDRGKVRDSYYFSPFGEIPDFPKANNRESIIKELIETEFGIDRNVKVPFGAKYLRPGSKISLRYFLMLTTISENIITSPSDFFDKQNEDRYREALPRIFDLAVGIETVENILAKEKKAELEAEIKKMERMQNRSSSKKDDFQDQRTDIVKRAKEFGLIEPDSDATTAMQLLSNILADVTSDKLVDGNSTEYSKLKSQEYQLNRVVRNLKNLKNEYSMFKDALTDVEDSVKPIVYLQGKKSEIIRTSIYEDIVTALENDFMALKKDIKSKTPVDTNVLDLIHEHENKLTDVRKKLAALPQKITSFLSDKDKYLFMGEMKAKLELYGEQVQSSSVENTTELYDLQEKLDALPVSDSTENRAMFIKLLEEIIQEYVNIAGKVLQNYEKYHPVFDYTKKALLLRKPLTDYIENVGSSSNHMFMHLFLFCGLHEAIQIKKTPFIPPYLIIDQPSRPYWGDREAPKLKLDHGDEANIRNAFELLNTFVDRIEKLNGQCQLIVFEHVPPSTWARLNHVHLVEEFFSDNALIPESWLQTETGGN
jgi:hypothetical protein